MKKTLLLGAMVAAISLLSPQPAFSHCEIPCGIYGDEMRFDMIEENIRTVEKSMKLITELSKEGEKNYNQIVRVINKEKHAKRIQRIVYQYFMTQRVKPVSAEKKDEYKKYLEKLELLHQMLVYAMKAKQTTDLGHVTTLRSLLTRFRTAYFAH
jgi:nickel superoxide dismutase